MKGELDDPCRPPEKNRPGPAETFAGTPGEPKASTATVAPPPKRRRRNRKVDPDKKYECTFEGCTKSYSRAEHLQRHCLNRCKKQFVRHDLCVRHKERHCANPPSFRHRDNAVAINIKARDSHDSQGPISVSPETHIAPSIQKTSSVGTSDAEHGPSSHLSPVGTDSTPPSCSDSTYMGLRVRIDPNDALYRNQDVQIPLKHFGPLQQNLSYGDAPASATSNQSIYSFGLPGDHHQSSTHNPPAPAASIADSFGNLNSVSAVGTASIAALNAPALESTHAFNSSSGHAAAITESLVHPPAPAPYNPTQQCQPAELPFPYSDGGTQNKSQHGVPDMAGSFLSLQNPAFACGAPWAHMESMPFSMSLFGDEFERGHFGAGIDMYEWFFNGNSSPTSTYSYSAVAPNQYADSYTQMPPSMFSQDYASDMMSQHHPMTITSVVNGSPHSLLSDNKRLKIIEYMRTQFTDPGSEADEPTRQSQFDEILQGDVDSADHVLSARMMQHYLASYWHYSDGEVPILHKPTFIPDQTCIPLLLSVIALGAATLNGPWGQDMIDKTSKLATFIATHLRWKIFTHPHAQAPAKLWVFQALVLLELYEKMYSTRSLHERAHTHHDGLLTLMRRGSSLITRAPESPPMRNGDNQESPEGGNGAAGMDSMSAKRIWARFIETESTRRVAFAAFTMDSLHATMFGHSVKMVVHGLKLSLPCHEALWQASSAIEAAQVQHELSCLDPEMTRPTMFLVALKKALNGNKVKTTAFGQTIIMSGLLSVSWNLTQRDIQAQSLGITGGRDEWRKTLLRAFDHWVEEYDEAMRESAVNPLLAADYPRNRNTAFGSRNVLHHLAHIASHIDAIDCQRFAGAGCLMNRYTTPSVYQATVRRMLEWAKKPSARDATYHALKLLYGIYILEGEGNGTTLPRLAEYRAKYDNLSHRPWTIYFAMLTIWAYGFALDGPLEGNMSYARNNGVPTYPPPDIQTAEGQRRDMFAFLMRAGSVVDPAELDIMPARNHCLGLLFVVRESLSNTRWELLTEAADLLGSCINKLLGYKSPEEVEAPYNAAAAVSLRMTPD
ncbi:hypothetical protein KEM56_000982 [Ascosphaera pollenicola]|nr:hypothetical protein KEM56_000982 [Ascosphaera pollenicola]